MNNLIRILFAAGSEGGGGADVATQLVAAQGQITTLTGERDTARTQLTALTTERDTARTQLTAVTTERDTARTELSTANSRVTTLTSERDTARTELATANTRITTLTTSQADFDSRLTAELVKHGVRPSGVTLPAGEKTGTAAQTGAQSDWRKGTNLTELAIAARAAEGKK
jgi:hypothetical protein